MMMKSTLGKLGAVALLTASMTLFAEETAPPAAAKAQKTADELLAFIPEDVVLLDDKVIVKKEDVVKILKPQLEQYLQNPDAAGIDAEQIKAVVYNLSKNLMTYEILLKNSLAEGGTLDLEAARELLNEQKSKQGEEHFNRVLAMQGMSFDELAQKVAGSMAIEKYHGKKVAEYNAANPIAEKEAHEFYDQHLEMFSQPASMSAAHILAKFVSDDPNEAEKEAAKNKLLTIKKQIAEGADFGELAKANSDCPSKEQNGSLGEFQEGQMVPEFEEALKKLKVNEISDPVETQFGFHLIKAGENKAASTLAFEQVQEQIVEQLQESKANDAFRKILDDLLAKENCTINLKEPKDAE
jgi:peptidyl-prolyl cis-trans isomerase C